MFLGSGQIRIRILIIRISIFMNYPDLDPDPLDPDSITSLLQLPCQQVLIRYNKFILKDFYG